MTPQAIACAAFLLGYSGPIPEIEVWSFNPENTWLCRRTYRDGCQAVTFRTPANDGHRIVVAIAPGAPFDLQVREALNVVRLVQDRTIHGTAAEDEGDRLQRRFGECKQ